MKVTHYNLTDQVYDILRHQIAERQLQAGEKIDITALAQQLGVSRMPVVDALKKLEAGGLVERRNRVGTFVTSIDKTMLVELYEARILLVRALTGKIIQNMRDEDIDILQEILDQSNQLFDNATSETFDYKRCRDYDLKFHLTLAELCGNSRIVQIYASLLPQFQLLRVYIHQRLPQSRESQREHQAILDAFKTRDVELAIKVQTYHLEHSCQAVLDHWAATEEEK